MSEQETIQEGQDTYLVFRLGEDLYGTHLLGVREVAEYQKPKSIPNSVKHMLGIINIRGEVIPAVDLRVRFGYNTPKDKDLAMLVFETDSGTIAAVVDHLEAVVELNPSEIEPGHTLNLGFPNDTLKGVGKHKMGMITLLDIKEILTLDQVGRPGSRAA